MNRRSIARLATTFASIWLLGAGVAAAQGADLQVYKWTFNLGIDPDTPAPAGGTLNYMVEVYNDGPDAAENVVVKDVLPPDTTFQATDNPGACSFNAGTRTITC